MKFSSIMIFLFLILNLNLNAQTILKGVVTDLANNPIPYSTVYLSKTTIGVTANGKGAYSFTIPENGVYELIASCIGFESHSQIIKADGTIKKLYE